MHPITLVDLPVAENAKGPGNDFFLSYPYLLVWTNQIDIWRFTDSSELMHVCTLADYLVKAYDEPAPIIDCARGLVILRVPYRTSPTQLRVFNLLDGKLAWDMSTYLKIPDMPIMYRKADGHALVLQVNDMPGPHGATGIVEVDVPGSQDDSDRGMGELHWCTLDGVELPLHLAAEREMHRDSPPLVLGPVFFGENGDIIVTSTTQWLTTVDLLHFRVQSSAGDRRLIKTLELLPNLEGCEQMLPASHLSIDESTLILCTHEIPSLSLTGQTSIRAINTESLTVVWNAAPVLGNVETLHYHPSSLHVIVVSSSHRILDHPEKPNFLQYQTFVVVLDSRTGKRRAIHSVDTITQGSYVEACLVSADAEDPVLGLVWVNGDVLTVGLADFIERGFEREDETGRARTLAVFPTAVIAAAMGKNGIVAMAGVRKHPVISQGYSEGDMPDWEEEPGNVMLAKWGCII